MNKQKKWDKRFVDLLSQIETWSSCLKRHVACIIMKDNRILTTGYNGAPAGVPSCVERNECIRYDSLSGQQLEHCWGVHAEQNAILQAAKLGISLEGATLYCSCKPCSHCSKMIINSGVKRIVYRDDYPDMFASKILDSSKNIEVEKYDRSSEN